MDRSAPGVPRTRLLAILAADAAGFSRLMSADDSGTLAALDAARESFRRHVGTQGGRIVDMAGDSVLAAFDTAAAAVRAALAVQDERRAALATVAADQRLLHRIGVHVGDVIEKDDGSVYGDGVNIAARLQTLAEPGGVVVSQAVREMVARRLGASFADLGEQSVKNIAQPVHAYAIGAAGPQRAAAWWRRRRPALLATAAGLVVAVVLGWWQPWRRDAAVSAADRKSIAVLPFEHLSSSADDRHLADGLHEEVLNALARVHSLKVISRTSVLEYREKKGNLREIGQRLGVAHILEGSVRREGNRMRLTLQLIDTRDDHHLLATNYDRELANLFSMQGEVARQVAESLSATITRQERGLLERVGTNHGDAYSRYLQARGARVGQVGELRIGESIRLLDESLALDPDFAEALALKAVWRVEAFHQHGRTQDADAGRAAFERALAIAPNLPDARRARALYTIYVIEDPHRALPELEAVAREQPNSAEAQVALAWVLRRIGQVARSLEHELLAQDLDPLNPSVTSPIVSIVGLRRWPEAVKQAELRLQRFPASSIGARALQARANVYMSGGKDLQPLRDVLREHGERLPPFFRFGVEAELAQAEGRWADAIAAWRKFPGQSPLQRALREGILQLAGGDTAGAEATWREAERQLAAEPAMGNRRNTQLRDAALLHSLLGQHEAALKAADAAREQTPESRDAINGPPLSFARSVILVRAGRVEEGVAEIRRLLRVPFGSPMDIFAPDPLRVLLKDDARFDELLNRPPRL